MSDRPSPLPKCASFSGPSSALSRLTRSAQAHLKVLELDDAVRKGRFKIDGEIVVRSPPSSQHHLEGLDDSVEVNVSKAAIEPVWHLAGVAERFGIDERDLRRALFEETGGMFPELQTRPDLKLFLPPVGGATVYVGLLVWLACANCELSCRSSDRHATCPTSRRRSPFEFMTNATGAMSSAAISVPADRICCMASKKPSRRRRRAA